MSESLHTLVEGLDDSGLTVTLLSSLDALVPGAWRNVTSFEQVVRDVTGETDEALLQKVGERALELYADRSQGYQRAVSVFRAVDSLDKMAGTAALAAKVGESFSFLSFLDKLTPKADTTQALDAGLKLGAELATFCLVNGLPGDSVSDFVRSLSSYAKEDKMRLAAWLAVDCILPLGPEFFARIDDALRSVDPGQLAGHGVFQAVEAHLPGGVEAKKALLGQTLGATRGFLEGLAATSGMTQQGILGRIRGFVDVSDSKLDYLSAMLDMSTSYFSHTGVQTVARRVVARAYGEI